MFSDLSADEKADAIADAAGEVIADAADEVNAAALKLADAAQDDGDLYDVAAMDPSERRHWEYCKRKCAVAPSLPNGEPDLSGAGLDMEDCMRLLEIMEKARMTDPAKVLRHKLMFGPGR